MTNDYPKDARGLIDPVRAAEQDRERRRRFYSDQPGSPRFEGGGAWEEHNRQKPGSSAFPNYNIHAAEQVSQADSANAKRSVTKLTEPSEAFQEGQDAALLGQVCNPYRQALRAVRDPESRYRLEALAKQWEDGFISKSGNNHGL